jgi:anti-sigma-K factor RskA
MGGRHEAAEYDNWNLDEYFESISLKRQRDYDRAHFWRSIIVGSVAAATSLIAYSLSVFKDEVRVTTLPQTLASRPICGC